MINRIPNADGPCNKVDLARSLERLPGQYRDFWPRTYILPDQDSTLNEELEAERDVFIIKPANGSLGVGLRLYRSGRRLFHESKTAITPRAQFVRIIQK
jgi:hypothetical protein